jgi:hypothetical protein
MGSAFISKKLCELSEQVLVASLAAGRIVQSRMEAVDAWGG